jgi:hypothetical protein
MLRLGGHVAEKILQVNLGLNVGTAEYREIASSVAQAFAAVPGLRWKLWLLNEERREAGGIYLFEDEGALEAFLSGDLARTIKTHPALRDASIKQFDVLSDVSSITRAPVGATITA